MTKRQAIISLSILVFGIFLIPFVLSYNGHPGFAVVTGMVSFITFCRWPKEPQ